MRDTGELIGAMVDAAARNGALLDNIATQSGAQALVQGFVQANGDGSLTVGCYLYDVLAKTELAHQGFVVQPPQWRRARSWAHA